MKKNLAVNKVKYVTVPQDDIGKLEECRKSLCEKLTESEIMEGATMPIWKITHCRYKEYIKDKKEGQNE